MRWWLAPESISLLEFSIIAKWILKQKLSWKIISFGILEGIKRLLDRKKDFGPGISHLIQIVCIKSIKTEEKIDKKRL